MGGRRLAVWLAGAGLALWTGAAEAGPAAAATRPAAAPDIYDFHVGGLRIGAFAVSLERAPGRYAGRLSFETQGVVRRFFAFALDLSAEGEIGPAGWRPLRYAADARGKKRREVEIRYGAGGAPEVSARPPFEPKPWSIEAGTQAGTLDPLSAILAALAAPPGAEPCLRRVEVFDGRRRHAAQMAPDRPIAEGVRCKAELRRVAGFKPKMLEKPPFDFAVDYVRRADGGHRFARAVAETPFGTAVLALRPER